MSRSENPVAVRIYLAIHPILYALVLGLIGAVTCYLSTLIPAYLSPYLGAPYLDPGWGLAMIFGLLVGALFGLVLGLIIGLSASIRSWANAGWKRLLSRATLIGIGTTVAASVVVCLLLIIMTAAAY